MVDAAVTAQYSGFWRRFGGLIIDGIIVAIITGVIHAILHAAGVDSIALRAAVGLLVGLIYYIWGWGTGQTVGMMALKMRMLDQATGSAPGSGKAIIRYIIYSVCGITLILSIIGGLWLVWDSRKQTWWDKAAGTIVVDV